MVGILATIHQAETNEKYLCRELSKTYSLFFSYYGRQTHGQKSKQIKPAIK
jgi:hypothetical protein